jgi:sugar O-acyltransferase (sialic acid O-acetyltransferase NeuD family)
MNTGLYLIGGGGHCRACIDVIEAEGQFRILGIIDLPAKLHTRNLGYEVLATDEDLHSLVCKDSGFLVTIGQVESPALRQSVYSSLKRLNSFLPRIVSPLSHVSRHALIEEATIIMHGVTVNAGARVGVNCILNSHSLVEHDARVGNHCHVSTGAVVNGGCRVGDGTFIGSNSVLVHGVSVVANVVVGAGSVVSRDITEAGVYAGNPCRRIR